MASHNDNNRINPKTNSNFQVWYYKIDDTTLGIKVQIQNVFFFGYHGVTKGDNVYVTSINLEGMTLD